MHLNLLCSGGESINNSFHRCDRLQCVIDTGIIYHNIFACFASLCFGVSIFLDRNAIYSIIPIQSGVAALALKKVGLPLCQWRYTSVIIGTSVKPTCIQIQSSTGALKPNYLSFHVDLSVSISVISIKTEISDNHLHSALYPQTAHKLSMK